jgi:OmpA-OmpF porin, OOP family
MKRKSMATLVAVFFAAAVHLPDADAQGVKVLKGNELRESSIIEALAPPEDGVRTRSIRVRPTGSAPAAGQGQGSASIIVTFATDSAEISEQAKSALDVVGRALNSDKLANFKFAIEGHADPRGGSDYNLKLSQARAESVAEYLEKYHHVSPDRLRPIGKGDQELANPNVPTAPENRRVTFKTQIE